MQSWSAASGRTDCQSCLREPLFSIKRISTEGGDQKIPLLSTKEGRYGRYGTKIPRRTLPVLLKKLLSFEVIDVSCELATEGNVVLGERWEAKSVDS